MHFVVLIFDLLPLLIGINLINLLLLLLSGQINTATGYQAEEYRNQGRISGLALDRFSGLELNRISGIELDNRKHVFFGTACNTIVRVVTVSIVTRK